MITCQAFPRWTPTKRIFDLLEKKGFFFLVDALVLVAYSPLLSKKNVLMPKVEVHVFYKKKINCTRGSNILNLVRLNKSWSFDAVFYLKWLL